MKARALQRFSDEALDRSRHLTPNQILDFLEDFRALHGGEPVRSKLISLKVPTDLLRAFRAKSELEGVPYQTQIKRLMKAWLLDRSEPEA